MKTANRILKEIEVISYEPQYREAFKELNLSWINKYFKVEQDDIEILNDPEKVILESGGYILLLKHHDRIIGTAAIKYLGRETFELNKVTVDEKYQGIGAGRLLCLSAIEKARSVGAKSLILYSATCLEAAIAIYKKLGFVEIPLEESMYKRVDIKMGLKL